MQTITMPKAGKNSSGTIKKWLIAEGASFNAGDVLAVVEFEDSLGEVTASSAGRLAKILAGEKKTVATGESIAQTDSAGKSAPAAKSSAPAVKPAAPLKGNPEAVTVIIMPKRSNDMEEGTIVKWLVKEGDKVTKGQPIFEIETDKTSVEIEAEVDGRIAKIIIGEGASAPITAPVALICDKNDDAAAWLAVNSAPAAQVEEASTAPVNIELPENVTTILMPQRSNDMEEGTIVKWLVKEGDKVTKGQPIFEIETDKTSVEIEAEVDGKLAKILLQEGQSAPIKTVVALVCDNVADADKYAAGLAAQAAAEKLAVAKPAESAEKTVAAAPAQAVVPTTPSVAAAPAVQRMAAQVVAGRVKASPAARRIAAQRGVNLAAISAGSGPHGRIISTDVPAAPVAAATVTGKPLPAAAPVVTGPVGEVTITTMKGMRKAIATNLTKSKQNIPHFYLRFTVDAGPMLSFYKSQKAMFKCSVNDVVLMAVGRAMHEFPALRSRLEGDNVVEYPTACIGIAVGLEGGLVVPVLKDADRMTFAEIAAASRDLATQARNGKVVNMGKGSFTISNMGMFGVEEFGAIINPPESGILAVGAAREGVIVENGAMRIGKIMTATISCDHRIVDGMLVAQFAGRLKELLENPQVML
ncbi:MAG TPA: 2-oxo acid dehydrogenase subunit E2 [Phycisphaerae bacterium]|nr:2-oxo acid dehydrogenase subunit E2 [Phycisphaerae bacterium]